MSHIVQIQTQIRDPEAVRAACHRLKLPMPIPGETTLYINTVTGLAVQLPDWRYPVVCDVTTGRLHFDNFRGQWGAQTELDRFLQAYAVEKASLEARRQGHSVTEQSLPDGSLRLTIQVAGGVA